MKTDQNVNHLPLGLATALSQLSAHGFAKWAQHVKVDLENMFAPGVNGNFPRWLELLAQLPSHSSDVCDFNSPTVTIGEDCLSTENKQFLRQLLLQLFPWRKGPFSVFGVLIDAEWQSHIKWERLANLIAPLAGKRVLDVGCGNGYYAMRMLGAGASWVLGVDPSVLALAQLTTLKHFMQQELPFTYLPIEMQSVPDRLQAFDTVFSMGVLYHRRDPLQHLQHLYHSLASGGQLVLETLVIDGDLKDVLVPAGRYAQMNNVWYLPSVPELCYQLTKLGLKNVRCIDVSCTTTDEQRTTEWMPFHSLKDFLHPADSMLTTEGHPRPQRAIILAEA
jgi:tRNA (mo5U34)-methyltransferase